MVWSMLHVVGMGILFVYTLGRAKRAETRRLALVPLGVIAVELTVAGMLSASLYPVLTGILAVTRLVIAGCCVAAVRRDAAMAKAQARMRARRQRRASAQLRALQAQPSASVPSRFPRCA